MFPFISLQDCAPGYHRGKLPESGRGPRPLLAPCVPCSCNNHSDACDPETGKCLVCLSVRFIRTGTEPLHFQSNVIPVPWFRKSLTLTKCKMYIYFPQKVFSKWFDIIGRKYFIKCTSLNLWVSNWELVKWTCATGSWSQSRWELFAYNLESLLKVLKSVNVNVENLFLWAKCCFLFSFFKNACSPGHLSMHLPLSHLPTPRPWLISGTYREFWPLKRNKWPRQKSCGPDWGYTPVSDFA